MGDLGDGSKYYKQFDLRFNKSTPKHEFLLHEKNMVAYIKSPAWTDFSFAGEIYTYVYIYIIHIYIYIYILYKFMQLGSHVFSPYNNITAPSNIWTLSPWRHNSTSC